MSPSGTIWRYTEGIETFCRKIRRNGPNHKYIYQLQNDLAVNLRHFPSNPKQGVISYLENTRGKKISRFQRKTYDNCVLRNWPD